VGTKADTFDFLGLTHIGARSRRWKFTVRLKTMRKRLRRSFNRVAQWYQAHRHDDVSKQRATLNAKLRALQILRPIDELSQPVAVLPGRLEEMVGSKVTGKDPDVGSLRTAPSTLSASAPPDHETLRPARRVLPEEPTAVILHGGVCEGGGSAARLWCLILPYSRESSHGFLPGPLF